MAQSNKWLPYRNSRRARSSCANRRISREQLCLLKLKILFRKVLAVVWNRLDLLNRTSSTRYRASKSDFLTCPFSQNQFRGWLSAASDAFGMGGGELLRVRFSF